MAQTIIDIINSFYYSWPLIGVLIMFLAFLFDRKQMDIKLDGVAKFIAFMFIVMLIQICTWDGKMVPTHSVIKSMKGFLTVFLEDAFFVMLPYYLCKLFQTKTSKFVIWLFFSLLFGYGHIYLGTTWAAITVIYPFFISYNYAKKSSFATVMACHFIYDCLIFLLPKINNLLSMV